MHVHGFCAFGLDLTIDDALGHEVVCLYVRGGLFVSQIFEYDAEVDGLTCCNLESA